jgi:hypothetical protein
MTTRKLSCMACIFLLCLLFTVPLTSAGPDQGPMPQTPLLIDCAVSPSFNTGQVAVTSSVILVRAAPLTSPTYRYSIVLTNTSTSVTVYVGNSTSVTSSTGHALLPGCSLTLDRSYSSVYGITASSSATVTFLEEAK